METFRLQNQRCSDDLRESVYPPGVNYNANRYRSRFAKKVRVDMWVQKSGCYSTMGPPRAFCCERPEYFSKKHSGFPPLFVDRFALRNQHAELAQRVAAASEERRQRYGMTSRCCCPIPRVDRGERDFIRENALHVIRTPHRRTKRCYRNEGGCHWIDLSDGPLVLRPGFGQVPNYIQQRKRELYCQDQVCRREMEAAQLPPNYRMMDPCERSYLINGLKTRWEELTRDFLRLPSNGDEGVEVEKGGLEDQLKAVESDLRLLNTNGPILVSREACESSGPSTGPCSSRQSQTPSGGPSSCSSLQSQNQYPEQSQNQGSNVY